MLADAGDVDAAVAAARAAFPAWSGAPPGRAVRRAHPAGRRARPTGPTSWPAPRRRQTGKPIRLATGFDVPGTVDNVAFFAGAARNLEGKAAGEYSGDHTSYVRREAIGVVGSVAPWNYPLQMAAWKVLPAIAAGNTIVLKPAELTPLTSLMLAEAAAEAGIPDGVVNVVTGTGRVAGEALMGHPDVDMVSFTGSSAVGRRVMELAAGSANGPKRVHLELGGKAPFLVFDDADLDAAVQGAVAGALINTGQDCTAATRAYVQRPALRRVRGRRGRPDGHRRARRSVGQSDRPGPAGLSRASRSGWPASSTAPARDGAKVVRGGVVPGGALARGAYYEPTLVVDAAQASEIVQDEVFGPVLVVLPFDGDDEGLALANDTPYGLAASAWTRDVFRSLRASREIRAGCVWINDHIPIISEMPHGGYKSSGTGKDMSLYSLEEYTNIKHVMYDGTAAVRKDWHRTVFTGSTGSTG